MKILVVLALMISLLACAAGLSTDIAETGSSTGTRPAAETRPNAPEPAAPVKSPHGYIIDKDYEPGRFGGFIGDCSDNQNWPYFWQCMSENAGNGGFK